MRRVLRPPIPQGKALHRVLRPPRLRRVAARPATSSNKEWHDWIVKRDGQLATFRRYIRENPMRAAMRRKNARFFGSARRVSFLGREWFAYGNAEILRLPELVPIKGHRTTPPGSPEWNALLATASRIGPGGMLRTGRRCGPGACVDGGLGQRRGALLL